MRGGVSVHDLQKGDGRPDERGGDVVNQALILGGITAMSAALIHCQFDYLFYLPSNAVVFMAIAGMTYRLSIQSDKAEDRGQKSDVRSQRSEVGCQRSGELVRKEEGEDVGILG